MKPIQDISSFFFTMCVVKVLTFISLFFKHGLNLLGSIDTIVEIRVLVPFAFPRKHRKLFLHQIIAIKPFRRANGVISVNPNFKSFEVYVVIVSMSLDR